MEKFDLIFYKGKNIISKIIRLISKSDYTHVALYLGDFHVVETDFMLNLSVRHIIYKRKDYDVYRVENITAKQREKLEEFINMTISSHYDYKLVMSHFSNYFFDNKIRGSKNKFDCSEWIDLAFKYAGIDLLPSYNKSTVTPADLSKSPRITRVC